MADDNNSVELAASVTAAWLATQHTRAAADDAAGLLRSVHDAIGQLTAPAPAADPEPQRYSPAVSVRKSLASPDHILSLIDGKPYRSLRRHLSANGLTPDEYRQRYGLPADYPMVAPAYSSARSEHAKRLGLGRRRRKAANAPTLKQPVEAKPKRGGRKSIADAKAAAQAHLRGN